MEEFGKIREQVVFEAITCGEIIEEYENDKPYPSMLIYGRAQSERPLHIVRAYSEEDDLAIVITAYQPDPKLWMDYSPNLTNPKRVSLARALFLI